ncbi:hypothetical protein ACLOJK_013124 [Asimina triloba]
MNTSSIVFPNKGFPPIGTFRLAVKVGRKYLLRVVNAAMQDDLFFGIANHNLTIFGMDGTYLKPFVTQYIMITPGQTMDVLLVANQPPGLYYMAAEAYSSGNITYDNTTTTAVVEYANASTSALSSPVIPTLPLANDTAAAQNFFNQLRGLNDEQHPETVPQNITDHIYITVSVNLRSCPGDSCSGPNGSRLAASLNNISFVMPHISILQAYTQSINGVYGTNFPNRPPLYFNFTADNLPSYLLTPRLATEVRVLDFNASVEIVFQGTSLVEGENHPMHLHGYSFFVVGWGFGTFDPDNDPKSYNLVDPPLINTVGVPRQGWVAIRFLANNPGVWFMHCHLERHLTWGMKTTWIVKNGPGVNETISDPPADLPTC